MDSEKFIAAIASNNVSKVKNSLGSMDDETLDDGLMTARNRNRTKIIKLIKEELRNRGIDVEDLDTDE